MSLAKTAQVVPKRKKHMLKSTLKTYAGLNKNVYALFTLMLITSMGQFIFPYLSLILTTKFGIDAKSAGFWMSANSIAGFTGMLVFGKLSDKFGRRRMLIAILSVSIASAFLCMIFSNSMVLPFTILVMFFFMQGVRPINNAVIADTTPGKDRSRAFALLYLGLNIGAALGNVIAGYLFNDYFWIMFLITACTLIITTVIVFKFVDETRPSHENAAHHENSPSAERADHSNVFVLLFKKPVLLTIALIFILYMFTYSQSFFTLPLHLSQLFGEKGVKDYAHMNLLNCVLVIFLTTPIIALVKNVNPIKSLVFSGALMAAGFGMLALNIPSKLFFYLSTTIWTVGEILCFPGINAFVSNHSPINKRASLSSVITSIGFTGFWLGSALNGTIIQSRGIVSLWFVVLIVAIMATLFMGILFYVDKSRKQRPAHLEPFAPAI